MMLAAVRRKDFAVMKEMIRQDGSLVRAIVDEQSLLSSLKS